MRDEDFGQAVWPAMLAGAAILGSVLTACMMPFVAVAALAAATMDRGRATLTVAGCWAANQLIGFGFQGYPLDGSTLAWGGALGAAALVVAEVARFCAGRGGGGVGAAVFGFAAGFVAFEGLLYAFALVAGGTETFALPIAAAILGNDALWFAGLGLLYLELRRALPALFAPLRAH